MSNFCGSTSLHILVYGYPVSTTITLTGSLEGEAEGGEILLLLSGTPRVGRDVRNGTDEGGRQWY